MNIKVNRVITGCKTPEQMVVAQRYLDQAYKTSLISGYEYAVWLGTITGIAHVHGWEIPL